MWATDTLDNGQRWNLRHRSSLQDSNRRRVAWRLAGYPEHLQQHPPTRDAEVEDAADFSSVYRAYWCGAPDVHATKYHLASGPTSFNSCAYAAEKLWNIFNRNLYGVGTDLGDRCKCTSLLVCLHVHYLFAVVFLVLVPAISFVRTFNYCVWMPRALAPI